MTVIDRLYSAISIISIYMINMLFLLINICDLIFRRQSCTTVAYSSSSGDVTATDMINTLQNWADINGADALIQISGTTATVSQVFCTPVPLHVKVLLTLVGLLEHSLEVL